MCELIDKQSDMEVVGTANSGKRIVELAKETEFDIILMDIEMENLNAGITATEEIREQLGNASIIFLTVHDTNEMILTAMGAGAVDYPYQPLLLLFLYLQTISYSTSFTFMSTPPPAKTIGEKNKYTSFPAL